MQYNNIIKGLVILGGILMILPVQVYANHPLPLTETFNNGNRTICYVINDNNRGLDNVKFNGQTGQGNALKNEIDKGRAHLTSNTDMNVVESPNCQNFDDWVNAKYMNSNVKGQTDVSNPGQTNMFKTIYYNTNQAIDYRTSSTCSTPPPLSNLINPKFIAIHEFGHFAGLDHPLWWEEPFISDYHTAMKSYCNPGYASLSTDDKNQINGFY